MREVVKWRPWALLWFAVPEKPGYSECEWTQEEIDEATALLKAVAELGKSEDVARLRNLTPSGLQEYADFDGPNPQMKATSYLQDLADRIEALLPPR